MNRSRVMEAMAIIGHELRTPISGVMGVTDLLLTTNLDEEQREYLQAIRTSSELLLRMSNDLMEFARLSSDAIPSDRVEFSLRKTVHMVIQPLRSVADRKGLKLCYSVDFDVPDRLTGDPERLGQLLVNLIGNAIRYTERGEILVNVEREDSNGHEARVKFTVSDTGIGISPDKIDRIFRPFSRVDNRYDSQTQEVDHQWAYAGWNLSIPDPRAGRTGLHRLDGHQNLRRRLTAAAV